MDKKVFTAVRLKTGEMHIYDFGSVKLHAYKTNDPIDNEVFLVEKDGQVILIESPCFFENNRELEAYLRDHGLHPVGMLVAYHGAGGTFLPGVPKYATQNAVAYTRSGGGKALINNFASVFGQAFDASVHTVTNMLTPGRVTIGGVTMQVTVTSEAFDLEIPEINAVYTHMLGHDCHSIVAGAAHADAILAQLRGYLKKGFDLVLSSHYEPEDLKDVRTKIAYLERLKAIAVDSADADAFKSAARREFQGYGGENYLDMTAGFFFS